MKTLKAVLTADVVNSSSLNAKELDDLIFSLKTELKQWDTKYNFYRGDSFHALCNADNALSLALRLRAIVKAIPTTDMKGALDLRIAIGIGTVDEPVKNMATAKGEAFTLSGRELDIISKTNTRLAIRCSDEKLDNGMQALVILIDYLINKLSVKQAEVLAELLKGATQMEIARMLRKSQPTVNKIVQAANWAELEQAVQIYRKLVALIV